MKGANDIGGWMGWVVSGGVRCVTVGRVSFGASSSR